MKFVSLFYMIFIINNLVLKHEVQSRMSYIMWELFLS